MSTGASQNGHSSIVEMHLLVDGRNHPIAQLAADWLLLKHPTDLPPSHAEIRIRVDDNRSAWPVNLPDGATHESGEVRIGLVEAVVRV